ncbi:MAG: hypothetical protein ACHQ51_15025 [Elusimicrobiota bacterium]
MNLAVAAVGVDWGYAASGTPPGALFVGAGLILGGALLIAGVFLFSRRDGAPESFLSFRR